MKDKKQIQERIRPVLQTFPYIFSVQIASKAIIAVWMLLLGKVFQALLKSSGRVAVTSGDFKFLFTSWQGIGILLLGLVSLFIYVAFDLNTKIVLSRDLLTGENASIGRCMKEGFLSVGKLINLQGVIVVLYISLIAPILGVGLSISLTQGLYIPTFITAVIKSSVLYSALAGVVVLLFLSGGIANLFILHGIVIDKLTISKAARQSSNLIKANWKDYLKQNITFILLIAGVLAGIAILFLFLPLKVVSIFSLNGPISRLLTIFFVTAGVIVSALVALFAMPLYLIKMTQLFFFFF